MGDKMSTIVVDKENANSKSTALIGKSLTVNKSAGGHHLMTCQTPNEKRSVSVVTPQLKKCTSGLGCAEITNTGKKRAFGANLLNTIASGKTPQLSVSHATPLGSKLGSRCHTQLKMQQKEESEVLEPMVASDEHLPPVEHYFGNKYDDYADMHDYEAIDRLVEEIRSNTTASRARSPIRIYVDSSEVEQSCSKSLRKMNKAMRKKESRDMTRSIMSMDFDDTDMMPPPSLAGLKLDDDLDSYFY